MKPNYLFLSRVGLLGLILGVLIGLWLSAMILWGELEARVDSPYPPSPSMRIKCPLMLASSEAGKIEAQVVNSTWEDVRPTVQKHLNRAIEAPAARQVVPLAPKAAQTLTWPIDDSQQMFNRFVLVNVFQSPYRDNPSRLGSCGILLFSLFGLSGAQTFGLIFAVSLLMILLGSGLWLHARQQMNDYSNVSQAGVALGLITIGALFSSLVRWWGLTMIFDFLILLFLGTLATEFFTLPTPKKPTPKADVHHR